MSNNNLITMNDKTVAFAALKSFYESGHDLFGVFGNLILLAISDKNNLSPAQIKELLANKINFNLPEDVLRTILKRLRRDGLVEYSDIKNQNVISIRLTEQGKNQEKTVRENYKSADREKQSILTSLKNKGLPYSSEVLSREFNLFLENSTKQAVSILERDDTSSNTTFSKIQQDIVAYFVESEKSNPELLEKLKNFLYGQIIASSFLNRNFETNGNIGNLSIYLDTNIVFSLMGFHEDYYNLPVKEIIDLIKNCGAKLKVFSFTVDELKSILSIYLSEYGYYSSQIRVRSIFQTLKRKGVSKIDVMSLMERFEDKLEELGIEVDYSFEVDALMSEKQDQLSKLTTYKPNNSAISIKHDLSALLAIKKLRHKRSKFQWERSEAIFLSADNKLTAYDFIEHGHKENRTFPEVVFRSDLATLFWLKGKGGSDNAFLHNLFASYTHEKIISKQLWGKFTGELKKKRQEGLLTQEDIDRVVSLSETENILRDKKESGIAEILDDARIHEAREASIQKDKTLIENEKTIITQSQQIIKISEAIETHSKRFWSKLMNVSIALFLVSVICLVGYSILRFGLSTVSNVLQLILLLVILFGGYSIITKKEFKFLGFLIDYRVALENKLIARSIKKKKKDYGLSESI